MDSLKMVAVQLYCESGNIYAVAVSASNANSIGSGISDISTVLKVFMGQDSSNIPTQTNVATELSQTGNGISALEISKINYPWVIEANNYAVSVRFTANFTPEASAVNAMVAVGIGPSTIYYSTDGGIEWSGISNYISGNKLNDPFVNGQANCVTSDGHKFWVAGQGFIQDSGNGKVYPQIAISSDLGKSWTAFYDEANYNTSANVFSAVDTSSSENDNYDPTNYGTINAIAYSVSDNVLIAGGSNGLSQATLAVSTKGGKVMESAQFSDVIVQYSLPSPYVSVTSINCITCADNIAVAGCSGGNGTNNIIYSIPSEDQSLGSMWYPINSNIGSADIRAITYSGDRWVACSLDTSIYYSFDAKTWIQSGITFPGAPQSWSSLNVLIQANSNSNLSNTMSIMSVAWNGTEFIAKAGYYTYNSNNPSLATTVTDLTSSDGITWTLPASIESWGDTTQNQAFMGTIWSGKNWISAGWGSLPIYSSEDSQGNLTWSTGSLSSGSDNSYPPFINAVATLHALPFTDSFAVQNGAITAEMVASTLPSEFFISSVTDSGSSPNTAAVLYPFTAYIGPNMSHLVSNKKSYASSPVTIAENAFANTSITSATHDNVTYIGKNAFSGCLLLNSVDLSYNTTSIEEGAFTNSSISSTNVPISIATQFNPSTFPASTAAKFYVVFSKPSDGILTEIDVNQQLAYLGSAFYGKVNVTFDATVKVISNSAFKGNKYIYQLVISPYLESISQYAFQSCPNLTTVIPFYGISGVYTVSPSLVYIGKDAFNGNTSLTAVTLPSSLADIEPGAFLGCTNLWQVQIPVQFLYDLMVMYNIYFETNMMENESWESDAEWSAKGTFFTFNFQEYGQTVYSYSYAKQNYMAQQREKQAEKVYEHEKYEHSWHSPKNLLEDVAVIAVGAVGGELLAPALMKVGGYFLKAGSEYIGMGAAEGAQAAVETMTEDGEADAIGGASTGAGKSVDPDPFDDDPNPDAEPINVDEIPPPYMMTAEQAQEALANTKEILDEQEFLDDPIDYEPRFENYAGFWENRLAMITKFKPDMVLPSDLEDLLDKQLLDNWEVGTYSFRNIREVLLNTLVNMGAISKDASQAYIDDGYSGDLSAAIKARNAEVADAINNANAISGNYGEFVFPGVYSRPPIIQTLSDNAAKLSKDFGINFLSGGIGMVVSMPLWDYFASRNQYFLSPVMSEVSTTAASNQIMLENNYGNMNSIYSTPSVLSPISTPYTTSTPGSWILVSKVTYPPHHQTNSSSLRSAYEEVVKEVLGSRPENLYNRSELTFNHSSTIQGYNQYTFKLKIYRDFETVTESEKNDLAEKINSTLKEELMKYLPEGVTSQSQIPDVTTTTTTTTTTPNNPAVYPQLLGGGPSAGYSPKLVLLSEGGADRAHSRFMLRTGWNNALDSKQSTSFSSVNNTGNKNFVKDSSNFIQFRKLRAINQNYNDLKK
jgi:hypothetical protein